MQDDALSTGEKIVFGVGVSFLLPGAVVVIVGVMELCPESKGRFVIETQPVV
jgi:hypothetical protein